MRKLAALMTALVIACSTGLVHANEWTPTYQVGLHEKYFGQTGGLTIYDRPVVQSSVTLSRMDGTYGIIWTSFSGDGAMNDDFGDEIDIGIGRARTIKKGKILLDYGIAYYDLISLRQTRGDIIAPYIKVAKTAGKVRPYIYVEEEISTDNSVLDGGTLYKGGLQTAVDKYNINAAFGGHRRVFGFKAKPVSYVQLTISRDVPISKRFSVTPQVSWQHAFDRNGPDLAQSHGIRGGITLTYR